MQSGLQRTCPDPSKDEFDLKMSQLVCNKFGDRYKCYNLKKDETGNIELCNYIGRKEGIDKIALIGEFPNAIVMIGRSSEDSKTPDLFIQGEIECNIFEDESKTISLACHKPRF